MTPDEFRKAMPAFEWAQDEDVLPALARADAYFNVTAWGAQYNEGLANIVAHFISVTPRGGATPVVGAGDATMKTVGSVSVQRDARLLQLQIENPLLRTFWGQEYMRLANLLGLGGTVA